MATITPQAHSGGYLWRVGHKACWLLRGARDPILGGYQTILALISNNPDCVAFVENILNAVN